MESLEEEAEDQLQQRQIEQLEAFIEKQVVRELVEEIYRSDTIFRVYKFYVERVFEF